jgi:hypothetical protein
MAGLDPAIPLRRAQSVPKRDHRDKPGDDNGEFSGNRLLTTFLARTICNSSGPSKGAI